MDRLFSIHETRRSNTRHSRGKCDSKSSNRDTRAQKAVPKVSLCSHCRFLVQFRFFQAFFEIPVNFKSICYLLFASNGELINCKIVLDILEAAATKQKQKYKQN